MSVENAEQAVESFLAANYPCKCPQDYECPAEERCPGEIYEAEEVVRIVLEHVAASIWADGQAAGMHDGLLVAEITLGLEPGPLPGPTPNPHEKKDLT